jgi:two-component system, NtrC family, sensor histidine kinase HydH
METTYWKKRGGVSNERFVAGTQNPLGSIAPLRSISGGRHSRLKRPGHRAQESERLTLLGISAAAFAHEVANPLSAIFCALHFVKNELEGKHVNSPVLITTVAGIMQEVDRLGLLLNEFRALALPQNLDLQSTDIKKVIKEVLAIQMRVYTAAGCSVRLEFENDLPRVTLDTAKMKQVILNLCNNAIEAMPEGGCLTLKSYHSGQAIVLEIGDTGMGVPEDMDVFALFKTTKAGGSGLGLPIVQQIISAHNGTINYTTEPSHGTTFKISLPTTDLEI